MSILDRVKKTKTYIDPAGPKIGLGTYEHIGKQGTELIANALQLGYRLIDTADHYNNHREVGNAIKLSKVKREDFLLCTKVWKDRLLYRDVENDVSRFLDELRVSYIDTVLIHWPNSQFDMLESLQALKDLVNKGYIKSYGVSNFTVAHSQKAVDAGFKITYNQVEFHPLLNQKELYSYCSANNIKIMAHSSLAGGRCLVISKVLEMSQKYNKTPAQIVYAWLVGKGIIPIVGVENELHLKENFDAQFVKLSPEDISQLDNLNLPEYRHLVKDYAEFD